MMCLDPTDNGDYVLSWNQGKTIFQVPSDRNVNLLMIRGKSVYKGFDAFAAIFHCHQQLFPTTMMTMRKKLLSAFQTLNQNKCDLPTTSDLVTEINGL